MEEGGVATFVKNFHKFKNIDINKLCLAQHLEACAMEVEFHNRSCIIVTIYQAPAGNYNLFLNHLEVLLGHLTGEKREREREKFWLVVTLIQIFLCNLKHLLQSPTLSFNLSTRISKSYSPFRPNPHYCASLFLIMLLLNNAALGFNSGWRQ